MWDGNYCACPAGLRDINGVCRIPCGVYEQYINNRCECIQNYYRINNDQCSQCPSTHQWNPIMNSCIPLPPPNCLNGKVWNGRDCVCPQGYV